MPVTGSMPGHVYRAGEPSRTGRVGGESGLVALTVGEFELGPALAVPLIECGRIHGVLTAAQRAGAPAFSPGDLDMVGSFGNHAALAIDLAEARAEQELGRILDDRERIAADLHDHVIQRLFATGLSLQGAAALARDDPMKQRLATAIDELDGTIRQIRSAISNCTSGRRTGTAACAVGCSPWLPTSAQCSVSTRGCVFPDCWRTPCRRLSWRTCSRSCATRWAMSPGTSAPAASRST